MLDDLNELRTFQRILSLGSLSSAARDLGVGLPVVSKRLASLERRLGQRLINRTTRRLSPTNEGVALIGHVERALEELSAAEATFERGRSEPRGLLRVSAPVSLGRAHLVPLAARLVDRYPQLSIELKLDDRVNELVGEGVDVAVRIGRPADSRAIRRKLSDNRRILVAAPSYLNRYGRPRALRELPRHWCLAYNDAKKWRLEGLAGASEDVEIRTRLRANSGDAVTDWALAGMGIMFKSVVDVCGFLLSGQLERVLEDWQSPPTPIYALVGAGGPIPRRTRLFLDAVLAHLKSREDAGQKQPGTRGRAAR